MDTIYMTVELPETSDPKAAQELAHALETIVGEVGGVSDPEVDVEETARDLGAINPAVLISFLGQAAGVAGSVVAIVKAITSVRDLLKSKDKPQKLNAAQELLLSLDLEKVFVKINGVSIPVSELAKKETD
ncbi:MAG: hypothetical protein ABJI96_16240 [Paracoccaceae bacterium]